MTRNAVVRLMLVALVGSAPAAGYGADAYAVMFATSGQLLTSEPCVGLFWRARLVFFNAGAQEARVRFLGVSNAPPRPDASDLILPAGRSEIVSAFRGNWQGGGPLWVIHLDVPEGVLMESRGEAVTAPCPPSVGLSVFGGFALPIVRQLTAAGMPQYHLGTDVAANQRINVGVYNGGSVTANAVVETRRACDEGVIERRTFSIVPNTIVQTVGMSGNTAGCGDQLRGYSYVSYAVVTVDQPSLSFGAGLSNDMDPRVPVVGAVTR